MFRTTKYSSSARLIHAGLRYFFMHPFKQFGRCQDVLDYQTYQHNVSLYKHPMSPNEYIASLNIPCQRMNILCLHMNIPFLRLNILCLRMNILSPYEHNRVSLHRNIECLRTNALSPSQGYRILSYISLCPTCIAFRSAITRFININKFKFNFRVKWKT